MLNLKTIILSLMFISSLSFASGNNHKKHKKGKAMHHKMAMEACSSLSSGDSCSFDSKKKGTVTGTCMTKGSSEVLKCKPNKN